MSLRAAASVDSPPPAGALLALVLMLVLQGYTADRALVVPCHATRFGSWEGGRRTPSHAYHNP